MNMKPHQTWYKRDSSKLSDFIDCRRKYFYSHVLGWRSEIVSQDAHFGESWHKAREWMLINEYSDVLGAYEKFMLKYREVFDEDTDEMFPPKTPASALIGLASFAEHYQRDLRDNEVLYTEISGSVPVSEEESIYFRMDSIMREKESGKIFSWDHKTTKRFSRFWTDQFYLSLQSGTYTHCLYCMFPIEEVKGIEFCGTMFEYLKKGSRIRPKGYHVSFCRVPAWKSQEQMATWLWNINDILDDLDREMDRLHHCKEDDKVMMAFQMNPNSCTKYYGCAFHDFCMAWANPLQHCFGPPLGFVQDFWDPTEIETTNKMSLEWK